MESLDEAYIDSESTDNEIDIDAVKSTFRQKNPASNKFWQGVWDAVDVENYALLCRRLLIPLSCGCRIKEDKDTASAVSDTYD
ncbi:hypothetical protein, partial [Salinadaptatus halalkaliphilus]|uniref:hypothetical protein n=1 Tax=Salinadaptatus halalkaliphilus TaxID=2419781 RepID=UPI001C2C31BC